MSLDVSPDGSEIAFTPDAGGGDNIWIMNADGTEPRQLTKEDFRLLNNPYWSPDGRRSKWLSRFVFINQLLGRPLLWVHDCA